jgi:3'-5' exonuclease
MNLYLDIETIPTKSDAVRSAIAQTINPPGSISKADTIAAWVAEKKPAAVKEAIAKTSLDGAYGNICCIGWAVDDDEAISFHAEDEKLVIGSFIASIATEVTKRRNALPTIIGHNVVNFDIRFIWQRAIVLGIRMPHWFPRDPKPWDREVFDTMIAFAGARGTVGMAKLCDAMGLEGKGEIDGSMVGDLWAAGQHEKIAEYCRGDVERSRQIHRRMQLAFGEAA